jgi:hypothetical protein
MSWNDFNSADDQQQFDVIPRGTIAKVRMSIKPGGYNDPHQGWTGGYATDNPNTGSVYLSCEFVVLEGPHAKRKIWSLIGLHSEKGPEWSNMGRTMIKGILNSAHRLMPEDNSPTAQQARRIEGLHALDHLEFVVQIGVKEDRDGELRNTIRRVITPDHSDYQTIMTGVPVMASAPTAQAAPTASAPTQSTPAAASPTGRPAWAQ